MMLNGPFKMHFWVAIGCVKLLGTRCVPRNATLLSQAAERGVNSIVQTNWAPRRGATGWF